MAIRPTTNPKTLPVPHRISLVRVPLGIGMGGGIRKSGEGATLKVADPVKF